MKISTKTRYGLRSIAELARGYPDEPIPLGDISRRQQVSPKYLEHIFAALKAAGLVRPVRGVRGGYLLTRSPEKTTLREVFEALEGPLVLADCQRPSRACPLQATCPTFDVWTDMTRAITEVLEASTIQDLFERGERMRRERVPDYVI